MSIKTLLLKSAGFGAGFALAISAIIGIAIYVTSLPKSERKWDDNAVTASFSEVTFNTGEAPTVNLSFTLNNTTGRDYSVPNDKDSIFMELPDTKALYQYNNSPDPFLQTVSIDPTFIPSNQRALVTLHLIYSYNDFYPKADKENTEKMAKYIAKRLERIDGFQLFDKANRYEIIFPNGWKKTTDAVAK
jgi:hypothetical protein